MAGKIFQIGDRVNWQSSGGRMAQGRVVRIATESGRVGDFVYNASRQEPRYIVETDDGRRAAHRAEALSHAQTVQA
jgi:hypothetical protein